MKRIEETPLAMTSKFILKCLDNLNTLVAKNWARFDYFLDVISAFALGDQDVNSTFTEEEKLAQERIGLEYLFRQ